jgi:eukaryotic-like serine/threonine-protein kinase
MTHPERLGKYHVTGILGEGAMGVVYKGYDPGIQRVVALKTVRRQLLESNEYGISMQARFRNEAQAAGRLAHPGIVGVYDYGDEGDVAYIAMEYVEGNTLERYVASQVRFSEEDVVSVIVQLLDALDHAHGHGVWHRDIKPANLLMTRQGVLKVADFGIARIESAGLTQSASVIGTPTYMAPEQFLGQAIDRRVDIYGSGVLLYQLLVGRPPFVGTTESLSYRVVHEAPVLPSAVPGSTCGTTFDSLLAVALAKHPDQRYPTAAAFKQALKATVGRPVQATVSDATVIALPARPTGAAAGGSPSRGQAAPGGSGAATQFEPGALAEAEHSLARHVGPLAAVLVRRAARECTDLPSLYARLAEQVSNPSAREAFLTHAARRTHGTGTPATGGRGTGAPAVAAGTVLTTGNVHAAPVLPLTDALIGHSTKLLAAHVGPIATVVVKRALSRTSQRDLFFNALLDAVPDAAAREKLRGDLARLS